ncbi:BREX-1 system adenine-specific DNA-methyltransferase PglX [Methanobrevibacter boviskoreani]|uniref:BREX-1 system adenine-specific DNA-methyltransferase PglX n=1 Tax=Methanobrevibacter boviskoreani TaxID=1348249 RepID=UPI0023F344E5|nr:BREX-1 system adenine-specific DNA-methyltransferase PglX [Methanobrevibacter boviskoreani]MDD6257118.1 BREX-1 system adenine-specific DNA-methyltransferase PglX [Methanobrevibacter boviskoreani]
MDKKALKTFSIEARKNLIENTIYKLSLIGITKENPHGEPISKSKGIEVYKVSEFNNYTIYDDDIIKRKNLIKEIDSKGFDNVVEEVAYTWFNRIIAIRFMEVNNYLPTKTRVLSSETPNKIEPDIIRYALDLDLDYSDEDKELIIKLKDENELDELFRFLFIKQCNKLNDILPGLFEKTDDYFELLLNISFTDENGVVRQLIDNIPEEDFKNQVEIIGWLYQFYNSELKDKIFADLKKKIKITKERIPAATQLFTPDWIVKYMVENSLGRLWLEGHPDSDLKYKWKYYVEEADQDEEVNLKLLEIRKESEKLKPEDIKIIDPCMGSGHILVYVFDVLMQIYISEGYTEKDATISILKNNLYGLDIDDRAYQLAYFSIMMKARSYNRKILKQDIKPLVYSIKESNNISEEFIDLCISYKPEIERDLLDIIKDFKDAKEYGSILNCNNYNIGELYDVLNNFKNNNLNKYKYINELKLLKNIFNQNQILSNKYNIVITNPPYMGSKGMDQDLNKFLKSNYPDSKSDLFAVFIEKCHDLTKNNNFFSMITQQSFMFLSTFENLRKEIIKNNTIINMAHLGAHAFDEIGGEVVQATTFVLRKNQLKNYNSTFHRLVNYNSEEEKEVEFFNDKNRYTIKQQNFTKIPGIPISYWISNELINNFDKGICIDKISDHTGSQNKTANNDKYIRYFWEVSNLDLGVGNKWIFYAKGGNFRKYWGNLNLVVDWSLEARNFYSNNPTSNLLDKKYWFKKGITYTKISSKGPSFRLLPKNCIFDMGGPSLCNLGDNLYYILGLFNSNVISFYLNILNPTLNIQSKDIRSLPILLNKFYKDEISNLVFENIIISKKDYDTFETSFSFKKHYLINDFSNKLKINFNKIKKDKIVEFNKFYNNEVKINEIFYKIYNFTKNYKEIINKNDITLNIPNLKGSIKSFISYAVGCMFGRYSLDEEGLIFAGGKFDLKKYHKFIPDNDNIIPILDTEYFEDDIVGRFVEFVKICFGEETLEENLDFIAGALNKKGKTSREIIRNYFLKDFFKDHVKTYQKCPIYWQFDSGKQDGFKCLIYMHRYDSNTVARIRTDYLHKTQKAMEENLNNCNNIIENSDIKSEVKEAEKSKNKLIKQLDEIKEYDEILAHIANQKIEIDLDDGVKINYQKFQNVEVSKDGQKTKKMNLLKKIK